MVYPPGFVVAHPLMAVVCIALITTQLDQVSTSASAFWVGTLAVAGAGILLGVRTIREVGLERNGEVRRGGGSLVLAGAGGLLASQLIDDPAASRLLLFLVATFFLAYVLSFNSLFAYRRRC